MDEITEEQMVGLGLEGHSWWDSSVMYDFPKTDNGVGLAVVFSRDYQRPRVMLHVGDCWADIEHVRSYRELVVFYHTVTGNAFVTYGLSEGGVKTGRLSLGKDRL